MNEAVIDAVRRIIMKWVITRTNLTSSALSGDSQIHVKNSKRFVIGDQFLIQNNAEEMENLLYVKDIPNETTIVIGDESGNLKQLRWDWDISNGAQVVKTQNNMFVKAVFFGDPDVITTLPAISVSAISDSSDPFTFRSSKEHYNIEIAVYVSEDTQEAGDRFLLNIVNTIKYGLKRNLYPLIDYSTTNLTADVQTGDTHIKVLDSTIVKPNHQIIIEDEHNSQVVGVTCILTDGTVNISLPADFNFSKDESVVIKPHRLPFNSWPTNTDYGKIKKGTLLKAAVISYFIDEMQDHPDANQGDVYLK